MSIPSNGTVPISIHEIGDNATGALVCESEGWTLEKGEWYLHPTKQSIDEGYRIDSSPGVADQGWHVLNTLSDMNIIGTRKVRLWRDSDSIAEEGMFTCHIKGDINTPVSVGIFYHSE